MTPHEVRYAVPDPTRTDRWTTHQRGAPARDARPPTTITPHQVRTRADPGSSSTLVRRFWATRSRSVGSAEEASTSNDPSEGGPPCNIRAAFWTFEAVTHMYLNTHDRMLTDRQRLRCGKVSRLLFRCSIGCPSRRFSDRSPRAVATEDLSTPRFRDGERRRRFHGRSRGFTPSTPSSQPCSIPSNSERIRCFSPLRLAGWMPTPTSWSPSWPTERTWMLTSIDSPPRSASAP